MASHLARLTADADGGVGVEAYWFRHKTPRISANDNPNKYRISNVEYRMSSAERPPGPVRHSTFDIRYSIFNISSPPRKKSSTFRHLADEHLPLMNGHIRI